MEYYTLEVKEREVCGYGTSHEPSKSTQEEARHTWGAAMIQRKHSHKEKQQSGYSKEMDIAEVGHWHRLCSPSSPLVPRDHQKQTSNPR